ncbi:uncharacterized protein LOC119445547 [Dermacentor silvarum]|uniref:uncharacterized protein LOC119445547 n=1 Tax=Dermacentor silvarum TaxID=543639 RepID=UPI002100BAC6|nr:uncharacterized protein LOC119445547 [Dermacentor silvarum]
MEGEWAASVEELKGELKVDRDRRIELETQMGELLDRQGAEAKLVERTAGELQEEREKRAVREECGGANGAGRRRGQRGVSGKEQRARAGGNTGARQCYSDVGRQASGGTGRAAGSPSPRVSGARRVEKQLPRTGGQQSQAGGERVERRVLVVGDSNVARVEQGVLTKVKADGRVRVEAQSGKCMVDALTKAQKAVWGNMEHENMVVIYAGLNDVLKGRSQNLKRRLEVGLRKLREASANVHVSIRRIPEVQGQASGMERSVVEANRVIRGLSRPLGYGVMDVNRDVYESGSHPFAQDGIHYSGATGRKVGRIGRQATAFLGGPRALRPPVYLKTDPERPQDSRNVVCRRTYRLKHQWQVYSDI